MRDLIIGGGGVSKMRFAIANRGKSGGARILYLYHGDEYPVFLFVAYAKSVRTNLTKAQTQALAVVAKRIIDAYGV